MNRILRIIIPILIAFVCTVTAFYLNVDCYNENSTNSEKYFSEIGYDNLQLSEDNSYIYIAGEEENNYTETEKAEMLSYLQDAEYIELTKIKACPLFWTAFKSQNYVCGLYNDLSSSDIVKYTDGNLYQYKNSVYLLTFTPGDYDSEMPTVTAYKLQNINSAKIESLKKDLGKDYYDKHVGTVYQYLYSNAADSEWYMHPFLIWVLLSVILIAVLWSITKIFQKKNKTDRKR